MRQISLIFLIIISSLSFKNQTKWKALGPNITPMPGADFEGWSANGIGRIFDIAVDYNNVDKIWACSPNGGLFYTQSKGRKWQSIPLPVPGGAIQIERVRTGKRTYRIYVASNISMANMDSYSYGVYSSDNNGKSWDTIHKLIPSEYKLATIGAMKWFNNQLVYSINDSVFSFRKGKRKLINLCGSDITSVVPSNQLNQWYICCENIWYTPDNGKNFKILKNGQNKEFQSKRCDLAFDQKNRAILIAHEDKGNYLYQISTKLALTQKKRIKAAIDVHRTQIVYDSSRNQFLIGGIRLYRLKDGNIDQLSFPNFPHKQFMHDDIRIIQFDRNANMLIGHDGGLSISENSGKKWFNINGCGLNITEIYDYDIDANVIIAGAQDLSSFQFNQKKREWSHFSKLYSDGGSCLIRNDTWYVMKGMRLVNTTNQGDQFNYPYVPARISRFNPRLHLNKNTFYLAGKHLWKEENGKWTNLSPGIERNYDVTGLVIQDSFMMLSKADPVWRSKNLTGKLYRTSNAGRNWEDITANFQPCSYRQISDLCATRDLSNVYACIGSFDNLHGDKDKVYMSKDKGNTWQNISYNLPNIPCTCVAFFPKIGLLLGTDRGVYILKDKNWIRLGKGLPQVPVTRFRLNKGKLIVSTYGRGLWFLK